MREHSYYVYMLTNTKNTVLYTGVTNHLERRLAEHRDQKLLVSLRNIIFGSSFMLKRQVT